MAYCGKCGALLAEGARFCQGCGLDLHAVGPTSRGADLPSEQGTPHLAPVAEPLGTQSGLKQNIAGLLCYAGAIFFLIGLVPPIVLLATEPHKRNRFVRFHAYQSILFTVLGFFVWWIVDLTTSSTGFFGGRHHSTLAIVVSISLILLWLFLMAKAWLNQMFKLPGIGDVALKLAG